MRQRAYCTMGTVIAAALCLAAGQALAQVAPQRDVTDVLPSGTTAYLRLSNLPGLYKAMDQSGLKSAITKSILMENPELALDVAACDKLLSRLQTLHVSFHGVRTVDEDLTDLDVLVIAEGKLGNDPRAWVPPLLKTVMREAGSFANVPIYEFAPTEERDGPPVPLLLCGVEGKILFATDRVLLENTLEAMMTGRGMPLSKNPDFMKASRGQMDKDVFLYASGPGALRAIADCMEGRDLKEFQSAIEVLDLNDIGCASCSIDYGASAACVKLMLKPDGKLCRLISLPAAAQTMPANLPQDVYLYAGASISDGAAVWKRATEHVCEKVIALKLVQNKENFYRPIQEAEQELNVRFEDMAACVNGQFGVFLYAPDFEEGGGFFAFVKEPAKAAALIEAIAAKQFPKDRREEDVQGVKIQAAGTEHNGLVWAAVNNCMLLGPRQDQIRKCIAAARGGNSLANSPAFKALSARLHRECAYSAYLNLAGLFRPDSGTRDVPPAIAEWAQGVALAATAVVKDGELEARFAQSRGGDPTEYCILLRTMIEQEMERKRRAREGGTR